MSCTSLTSGWWTLRRPCATCRSLA